MLDNTIKDPDWHIDKDMKTGTVTTSDENERLRFFFKRKNRLCLFYMMEHLPTQIIWERSPSFHRIADGTSLPLRDLIIIVES